jgi:hypothetical protein
MIEYPKMLFKCPGETAGNDGVSFDWVIADSADAELSLLDDGWSDYQSAIDSMREDGGNNADNAPPTRAELEAECDELGIKYDGRNSDASLAAKIEAVRSSK